MTWNEIMSKRDRLAGILRPHLGKQIARERANDIIQALVCSDEDGEDPSHLALRMLARDLESRTAEVVAYQLGRAWRLVPPAEIVGIDDIDQAPGALGNDLVGSAPAHPGVVRPRPAGAKIRGLWH